MRESTVLIKSAREAYCRTIRKTGVSKNEIENAVSYFLAASTTLGQVCFVLDTCVETGLTDRVPLPFDMFFSHSIGLVENISDASCMLHLIDRHCAKHAETAEAYEKTVFNALLNRLTKPQDAIDVFRFALNRYSHRIEDSDSVGYTVDILHMIYERILVVQSSISQEPIDVPRIAEEA